jgi:predicted lipid-binding transport protein (Tim44 family)
VAVAAAASGGTGGTASFLLDLVGLLMVIVFVVALAMVFVDTARLRQHAPAVRGPALATHRTSRRPVLVHPHHHRPHPVV